MTLHKKNYHETVNYLYELQKYGIKLGLENPLRLMDILGEPQKSFRSVHIAGTNGKGSTATIISSILQKNGFKVGLYTSPHLVSFTERISINNSPISESDVTRLTSFIRNSIDNTDLKPTFFEFVTAMAFYYFACKKVDWAVVEVGMGGRLDATNVLLPEVCVITNIGLDHNEFLGETFFDISSEKAGIIKSSVPVVTAATNPEALSVLDKTARNHGSEMHIYAKDFKSTLTYMDSEHIVFDYAGMSPYTPRTNGFRGYNNLSLTASGKHQLYNASLALRTCEILIHKGFPVSGDAVRNGLLNMNLEGRLELISQTPLIIIDSAHNPDAARSLASAVREIFPSKKIILIAGIMKDKDIKGILGPLALISDTVILTSPKSERAASPEKLMEHLTVLGETGRKNPIPGLTLSTKTVAEALDLAKTLWHKGNIILVTGSFYTTGELKELLGHSAGVFSHLRE